MGRVMPFVLSISLLNDIKVAFSLKAVHSISQPKIVFRNFFVFEKDLVHMYQNHFIYFPTLNFCFATSQKPILPAPGFPAMIERLKFMDFERRATAN